MDWKFEESLGNVVHDIDECYECGCWLVHVDDDFNGEDYNPSLHGAIEARSRYFQNPLQETVDSLTTELDELRQEVAVLRGELEGAQQELAARETVEPVMVGSPEDGIWHIPPPRRS